MNLRSIAIIAASAAIGFSLAGSALASPDRPEPREVPSVDQSHPDSIDKGDKSDGPRTSSHDVKDPVDRPETNSGR
jgi:hypothetical protein